MNFQHSYYDDEVKCDFYIPSMIKRTWATGLEILSDIDKVCRRNNILYFAEWGTLLGTVRHGGYIPWDDDLDICMKRADYEKFLSIAKDELPDGYDIVNYRTSPTYRQMLSRVVNTDHYRFDPEFLAKFSGLPFAMGIDIFPLDYISGDEEYEQQRFDLVYFIQETLDKLEKDGLSFSDISREIVLIERKCNTKIKTGQNLSSQLRFLLDRIYSEVPEEKAEDIALYALWFSDHSRKFPKKYYDSYTRMPFENITVPVPLFYNDILAKKYSSSYMVPVRSGSAHDYPYFQNHLDVLKEHFNFSWPEYTFNPDDLLHTNVIRKEDFNTHFAKSMELLFDLHQRISASLSDSAESALSLLRACQDEAIRIGTLIEMRYYIGSDTVHLLEEYCELLYDFSQNLPHFGLKTEISGNSPDFSSGKITILQDLIKKLDKCIQNTSFSFNRELSSVRFTLFISVYAKYFPALEKVINTYNRKDNTIVKIMPVSHIEISPDMTGISEEFDISDYPVCYEYIDFNNFSFDTHPDEIIINYPYDEFNALFTTRNDFYSGKLISNTEKLVYVSPFEVSTVKASDERSIKNLKYCACTSAVTLCDEIILFDEAIKNRYVEVLTSFSGEEYSSIWSNKITVADVWNENSSNISDDLAECTDNPEDKALLSCQETLSSPKKHRKSILYYIGINTLLGHESTSVDKLASTLAVANKHADKADIIILEQQNLREELSRLNPALYDKYLAFADNCKSQFFNNADTSIDNQESFMNIFSPEFFAKKYDAYYGEASYFATEFINLAKPVMIQNSNII